MTMINTSVYVSDVRKNDVLIQGLSDTVPVWLAQYHVQRIGNGGKHRVYATGDTQVALLQMLRDHGVAFAGGPDGWPPAEVFADIRGRGLVHGEFEEITFARPGSPATRRR